VRPSLHARLVDLPLWYGWSERSHAQLGELVVLTGADNGGVARVDPDDDDIRRYVVRHYAYDPQRRERRHQVLAAFDNRREFDRFFKKASADLHRRRAAGQEVEECEHISGVVLEPGHDHLHQNARTIARAIKHGADVSALLDQLELPPSVVVFRARREDASGQ
jgi:hypothetical protein